MIFFNFLINYYPIYIHGVVWEQKGQDESKKIEVSNNKRSQTGTHVAIGKIILNYVKETLFNEDTREDSKLAGSKNTFRIQSRTP